MSHAPVALPNCPNCGRALDGAFCAACGQKAGPINPTLHDFVHDFIHESLHVDGRIFRSIRFLLTRPGFLTREYFEGRRARYLSPIRLYLLFSVVYFAVAAVAPPPTRGSGLRVSGDAEEIRELGFESEAALQRAVTTAVNTWVPRAMFVLVPLFALLVKGVTRGTGRNYPQHLYFALHVHAAGFALLAIATAARYARAIPYAADVVWIVAIVWLVVYSTRAFRRAYGGTTARALARTVVVGLAYFVAIGAAIAGIIVPILVSGRPS